MHEKDNVTTYSFSHHHSSSTPYQHRTLNRHAPVLCCVLLFGVMLCGADYPGSRTVPKGRGGDQRVQAQGRHGDRRCERKLEGRGGEEKGWPGPTAFLSLLPPPPLGVFCVWLIVFGFGVHVFCG